MASPTNPPPMTISDAHRSVIAEIRRTFASDLPPDLDTDYNLARWARGWRGRMTEIVPRLRAYLENRRAAKLDSPDLLDTFGGHETCARLFKYFSMSLNTRRVDPQDNTLVFVYRLEDVRVDLIPKVMTAKEFVVLNFLGSEIMLRAVLRREAESGQQSGITILYDASHIRFQDFVNPSSPFMQYVRLGMELQQEYFCDLLRRLIVFRAPSFVDVLWEVSKRFMHSETRRKMVFIKKKNGCSAVDGLSKYLHPSVVPASYGGDWRESPNTTHQPNLTIDPCTCCIVPTPVDDETYAYKFHWQPSKSQWRTEHVRPKQTFELRLVVKSPAALIRWQFRISEEILFGVYLERTTNSNEDRRLVHPRLHLRTPILPEIDQLICAEYGTGTYIFTFTNRTTSVLSLKLDYAIELIE